MASDGEKGSASFQTRKQMCSDLDIIQTILSNHYAPAEWKKQHIGWDLEREVEKAKSSIWDMSEISVKDYQLILQNFFKTMKDYHTSVFFVSTEMASLPFEVHGVNDKIFITGIDRKKLPKESFPFEIGDELVLFDGVPAYEVVVDLQNRYSGDNNSETDRRFAEGFVTTRLGFFGHDVPRGPIIIDVKPKNDENTYSHQLSWEYVPEKINNDTPLFKSGTKEFSLRERAEAILDNNVKALKKFFPEEKKISSWSFGARESTIPELGNIVWKTKDDDLFNAYIFESPQQKRVGYIRIPTYMPDCSRCFLDEYVDAFAKIIEKFDSETDALIIDQINNPGGLVSYVYVLSSMLTKTALETPKHKMAISQENVFFAAMLLPELENIKSDDDAKAAFGDTFLGYPVSYEFVRIFIDYCRFIIEQWNKGSQITEPYHFLGMDYINPHYKANYTKPLMVVVNELDVSGGDFFPAILQDNQRATIFGTKTSGAGGMISVFQYPNIFGVRGFSYTTTIAERADKNPIENLGVKPDVEYSLTENDFQHGYKEYANAIVSAVETIFINDIEEDTVLINNDIEEEKEIVAVDDINDIDDFDEEFDVIEEYDGEEEYEVNDDTDESDGSELAESVGEGTE